MRDNTESVIIVGAGLAGLAAGCYARMNGYRTTMFESHYMAGGFATMFARKGYIFDIAMDWLNGINADEKDSLMWRELGYLRGRKISYFTDLLRVKDRQGRTWTFWADPDKLESELLQLTSYEEDRKLVHKLCNDIRKMIRAPAIEFTRPDTLMGKLDMLKLALKFLPYLRIMIEYNTVLSRDYAKRFRDPRLSEVMSYSYFDPAMPQSMFTMVYQIAGMNRRNLGFPEGGGHGLSEHLASLFTTMGGELHCLSPVEEILVRDGKAVGVRVKGVEHYADHVITACDTKTVVYKMLGGKFVNEDVSRIYERGQAYPSLLRVYLGVNRDFSNEPHSCVHLLDKPLDVPGLYQGHTKDSIMVRHYCHMDPAFAPPGKSILNSVFFADYDYWKDLRENDRKRYSLEKKRVGDLVISHLERLYPGISRDIEYVNVATPATYERYTGNHRGAIKAWVDDTTDISDHLKKVGMKLPGLDNLYMIGQWVVHGGMIRVVASGRHVIETMCKRGKRDFRAEIPRHVLARMDAARQKRKLDERSMQEKYSEPRALSA